MAMNKTDKFEVLLRLKSIELIAYWEGRLITTRIMGLFGVSRQQVSKDIRLYNTKYNLDALVHDPAVKGYVPVPQFSPVLTKSHINEYMSLFASLGNPSTALILLTEFNVAAVQLPDRAVQPEVVRPLIRACHLKESLKIRYASMSHPKVHTRTISPHTLVYSGFRWHVRAFCHTRQDFRDFVVSRFESTPEACDVLAPNIDEDRLWQEEVVLRIEPNKSLSAGQMRLIEADFKMTQGQFSLTVKKALAHYTLQRFQVAVTKEQVALASQFPLQLNRESSKQLKALLFG
jgi:predicted DNA-binding transcriptional regulator YafY